jgi:putative Ca2+/H+ antiporter (TMEM165/GDT1 family)
VWRAIQTHHHHFHPTLIKMAAVTASCSMITARPAVRVQARKSFAGAKVAPKATAAKAVFKTQAVCKSSEQNLVAAATVAAIVAAEAIAPQSALAEITPSLKNQLLSFVAGGSVLGAILVAVVGVSTFDKVNRK